MHLDIISSITSLHVSQISCKRSACLKPCRTDGPPHLATIWHAADQMTSVYSKVFHLQMVCFVGPGAFTAHTTRIANGHSILVTIQTSGVLVCNSPLEDGSCLLWHEVLDLPVPQCCHGFVMVLIRAMDAGEKILQRLH